MTTNEIQAPNRPAAPVRLLGMALFLIIGALAVVASSGVFAQPVSGTFDGFKVAPGTPIKIDADTLVVSRKARTATFTGRVVAVRGPMQLLAKSLVVTYQIVTRGTRKSGTEITRLAARGGVKVTNRNQVANGDWAVMDVRANKVTMGGNVVLRQGGTVIRGNRLNINLRSGLSQLVGSRGGGRVRGVFTPAKKRP